MGSLLETLNNQIGGDTIRQISQVLGADEGATGSAVQAALPLLVSALARNSARPEGADSLSQALSNDHDGSILDNLSGFLSSAGSGAGDGILQHILGSKRGAVETGLSNASGLDAGTISKLLPILAPIVMGALGRTQRQHGLDAQGLNGLLENERQKAASTAPPAFGMLTQMLDADGDGSVMDDIAKMGGGLLGNLLGGSK
jgi:hypothetical protein